MTMRPILVTTVLATLFVALVQTRAEDPPQPAGDDKQTEPLAGHSLHGEVFNEGPRQKAYLMGGTGDVRFEVTTSAPEAQQFFNQGVGQLHGFWYFEAERSFRHVAMLDPDCAMAYWGMAMANIENQKRASGFVKEAVKRKEAASRREQLWIDGLSDYLAAKKKESKEAKQQYIRSLESIIHEFPDDVEAKAFLAVRIWQFKGELPISSHQAVHALLDQVFAANPMHPAHHYRIHLWDREKPDQALQSAALGGPTAPRIAHLWHMPGHIYSRLHRYADAAWQQEASSRVDHAHMMRDRVMPDQIHNYAHNQEWLTRNLIHVGRSRDALGIATNLIELPRHPKSNKLDKSGGSASYGRARLFDVLTRFELWDELIQRSESMYLEPTDLPKEQDKRIRALGVAYFQRGEVTNLLAQLVELQARLVQSQSDKASKERIKVLEEAVAEMTAYAALLADKPEAAKTLLKEVRGLKKDQLARLHLRAGDHASAERLAKEAVDSAKNEVVPLANQVDILFRTGKKEESGKAFEALRQVSGHIDDLSLPPFQRLADVAVELGVPADWRVPPATPDDLGDRPPLDTIGPLRFHPWPATAWELPDSEGNLISLKQFAGRPVMVIFYLGYGCLHCAEQLTTFAPKTQAFEDAGISLIAISTDGVVDLKTSVDDFQSDGAFPIPLVSDAELNVFKAYRAYDDFENQPLHGTFLIDEHGLVRWQDISYEPFDDVDFLLKESQRLLRLPVKATAQFAAGNAPRTP